mgnify:CR=1 FL=1
MELFITHTFDIMDKTSNTFLLLIGLLITTLSMVINLKQNLNKNIQNFTKHSNIYKFIDIIYSTAVALIFLFILTISIKYFDFNLYLKLVISILFIIVSIYLLWNFFRIVYILKEVVKISFKDDK